MQNINVIICIILNFCCLNKYFSNEDDDEDCCCCCKWCENKITKNNTDKQKPDINNNNKKEENEEDENKDENIEEEKEEEEEEEIPKEFTNTKTLLGHENKVAAITQLKSGKLATGGYDNTIRIWDLTQNKENKIINEDGRIFVLLEFEENKLLSGTGNNIHLWDLNSDSKKYEKSFEGHTLWVNCLVKIDD